MRSVRRGVFPWILAALFSAAVAFFLQDSWTRFPRGLLTDDAYFYVKIARNLGIHGISTFDGLHRTDGYHLLWAWMLAAISALAGLVTPSPAFHLGAMLWLYLMVCWAIALRYGRSFVEACLLFMLGLFFKAMMETTLLAFLLLLLWEHEYLSPPGSSRWRWRPLLLALIPLVRVDAALILGLTALASLGGRSASPWRARLRNTLVDLGWIGAGVALQLTVHYAIFHEWATVSMLLKGMTEFSWHERLWENLTLPSNILSNAVFLLFWGLALRAAWQRRPEERFRHIVVVCAPAFFVLFHVAFNSAMSYWYFVPAVYPYAAYLLRTELPSKRWPRSAGLAALGLLAALFTAKWVADDHTRAAEMSWSSQFVEQVRQHVGPSDPIYQIDASGWMGWFSDRMIVNGDGLVNDHAYARRLLHHHIEGYLEEEGIRYIIQNDYPADGHLLTLAGWGLPMDSVETVIAPPPGLAGHCAFGLYRLKGSSIPNAEAP